MQAPRLASRTPFRIVECDGCLCCTKRISLSRPETVMLRVLHLCPQVAGTPDCKNSWGFQDAAAALRQMRFHHADHLPVSTALPWHRNNSTHITMQLSSYIITCRLLSHLIHLSSNVGACTKFIVSQSAQAKSCDRRAEYQFRLQFSLPPLWGPNSRDSPSPALPAQDFDVPGKPQVIPALFGNAGAQLQCIAQ